MKKWIFMAAATAIIAIAAMVYLLSGGGKDDSISAAQAGEAVISQYGGVIEETALTGEIYEVGFTREDGKYKAGVDRSTGRVLSVELIEKASEPVPEKLTEDEAKAIAVKEAGGVAGAIRYAEEANEYEVDITEGSTKKTVFVAADSGDIRKITDVAAEMPEPEPAPEPEPVLSQQEAIAIAKETLDGEVQEVEFTETTDGGYYLIEIENEELVKEATVQIHAIRGETMTVEWDD
ncbi:PepSY domain-containing protein [Planococcus sp. APC 3906]|uniref:PepSY domain-containing protein n=1 Tax=Planococcus sp. APC 3906 TaxID=3035194 RepID=UPI0025B40283|nr:PepSY domain-containing protein [Planococcus sp. APC 3906]MDN3450247.1 PepSY domain-containing protein [Planococcus sp. APC 3906]